MSGSGLGEARQVVAAFERRDEAAAGVPLGERHELARHPGEIIGLESQIGERIAAVRVETGGDDDEIGRENRRRAAGGPP